jgi:predicted nucleic acid-binding protein
MNNMFMETHSLDYKQFIELTNAINDVCKNKKVEELGMWGKAAFLLKQGKPLHQVIEELSNSL